jgi:molybdopterin synthase catalytic subunit
MKRELLITPSPIDETALLKARSVPCEAGAVVTFSGFVRGTEGGETIRALEYEAFREMAEHQFGRLFDAMEAKWPLHSVRLVHRVGVVPTNQPSLWVEIVAGHRGEAFAAVEWLIDEMKKVVPIWKKPLA